MTISAKQIQIIHVAKASLGLEEDDYRAILRQVAGVTSSRDLDVAGFRALMNRFERMGFTSTMPRPSGFGVRPGMASPRQVELIRDLWREYKGEDASDATLGRWLERTFHLSSIRFLGYDDARKVIGALKMMKARNFDRKPKDGGKAVLGTSGARKQKRASTPVADPFNGDVSLKSVESHAES